MDSIGNAHPESRAQIGIRQRRYHVFLMFSHPQFSVGVWQVKHSAWNLVLIPMILSTNWQITLLEKEFKNRRAQFLCILLLSSSEVFFFKPPPPMVIT